MSVPDGASAKSASYAARDHVHSAPRALSPGPVSRWGARPLERKKRGSLTAGRYRSGCVARAACRAVDPAPGAPMMKKLGSTAHLPIPTRTVEILGHGGR